MKTSEFGTSLAWGTSIEEVIGSQSNDRITGGEFTQRIQGRGGNDTIQGNSRGDTIWGGLGSDVVYGNAGNDQLVGDTGNPSFATWNSHDRLLGGSGNDRLWGENGNDVLLGQQHDDILFGGNGNDQLAGSDSFVSNERDQLYGGAGWDRFILGNAQGSFYQGSGYAIIKDWQAGVDKIQLGRTNGRYSLGTGNFSGGVAQDTGIYHNGDLVGVIEDSTNVSATRGDFVFA